MTVTGRGKLPRFEPTPKALAYLDRPRRRTLLQRLRRRIAR
jgi:hypothetical protein